MLLFLSKRFFLIEIDRHEYFMIGPALSFRHQIALVTLPECYFIVHFTGFPDFSVKRTSVKTGLVWND